MSVTNYIWDVENDSYLMETDENGETTAVYTNEPGQFGPLVSQRRNGATSTYHFDGQGSTRQLTDENENVTDTATYTAFGEDVASSGATPNPFGYKGALGYYANLESNDVYVRARTYAPTITSWLSLDPLLSARLVHQYQYSGNSPLNGGDPSGLRTEDIGGGCPCCCESITVRKHGKAPYPFPPNYGGGRGLGYTEGITIYGRDAYYRSNFRFVVEFVVRGDPRKCTYGQHVKAEAWKRRSNYNVTNPWTFDEWEYDDVLNPPEDVAPDVKVDRLGSGRTRISLQDAPGWSGSRSKETLDRNMPTWFEAQFMHKCQGWDQMDTMYVIWRLRHFVPEHNAVARGPRPEPFNAGSRDDLDTSIVSMLCGDFGKFIPPPVPTPDPNFTIDGPRPLF